MTLMEPYAVWLPMYSYTHSGTTVWCGDIPCDHNTRRIDGWILMAEETVTNNFGCADSWREKAIEVMKADVKELDSWCAGDVYGYVLYESSNDNTTDWEEIDSCGGFYGDTLETTGLVNAIGSGFYKELCEGRVEVGEAKVVITKSYVF